MNQNAKSSDAVNLVYPDFLRNSAYQNRTFKISVKKTIMSNDAKTLYNKAISTVNSAIDAGITSANTLSKSTLGTNVISTEHAKNDINATNINASITLPIPNTFLDSQNHGWSNETGVIGEVGIAAMQKLNILGINADKILGSAAQSAGLRKQLIDPGYFQNYTGSDPRTFSVSWGLVPNSAEDAAQIIKIVMRLKQYASPTKEITGVSLLSPYVFDIEIGNPHISTMADLKDVVISSIELNYGADGAMQMTADGVPKYMELSMTLNETQMKTSTDYFKNVPELPTKTSAPTKNVQRF